MQETEYVIGKSEFYTQKSTGNTSIYGSTAICVFEVVLPLASCHLAGPPGFQYSLSLLSYSVLPWQENGESDSAPLLPLTYHFYPRLRG